ncbi:hypothetical protein BDF20DRAFT_991187 [Mycotypha africana]|uniref:uncharacterized protein n=1 Tax=Mycotypha africana TaxID=64632 RepID=UPI002301814B|nr:uncharacterized protein BDF20DRAFT_991187 [Mycotypha africana]KAI8968219.1 hypothetical protein BDF20DRAFT_991187 [Mycotypha africana]
MKGLSSALFNDKERPVITMKNCYKTHNKVTNEDGPRKQCITNKQKLLDEATTIDLNRTTVVNISCIDADDNKANSTNEEKSRREGEEELVDDLKIEDYIVKAISTIGGCSISGEMQYGTEYRATIKDHHNVVSGSEQERRIADADTVNDNQILPPADTNDITPHAVLNQSTSLSITNSDDTLSNIRQIRHPSSVESRQPKKSSSWPSSLRKLLLPTEGANKTSSKRLLSSPTASTQIGNLATAVKSLQKPDSSRTSALFAILARKSSKKGAPKSNQTVQSNTIIPSSATSLGCASEKSVMLARSVSSEVIASDSSSIILCDNDSSIISKSSTISYPRLPVHLERAIYHLSHMKLSNPRRPLRDQVVISNLMFWYLSIFTQPLQTPHSSEITAMTDYDIDITPPQNNIPILSFMKKAFPIPLIPTTHDQQSCLVQQQLKQQQRGPLESNAMDLLNLHHHKQEILYSEKKRNGCKKKGSTKAAITTATIPQYNKKRLSAKYLKTTVCFSSDDEDDDDDDEEEEYDDNDDEGITRRSTFISLDDLEANNMLAGYKKQSKFNLMKHSFYKLKSSTKKQHLKTERRKSTPITDRKMPPQLQTTAGNNTEQLHQKRMITIKNDEDDIPLAMYKKDNKPF